MVVATPPTPARSGPPRRRRRTRRQRVLLGLGVVVAMLVVAGAAVVGYGWYRWNQIEQKDLQLAQAGLAGPQNFLIVGSDSRDAVQSTDADADAFLGEPGAAESGQRSDTIMIARVDAAAKTVDLLSFPRDLWVPIEPSGEAQRINTAYGLGGPQNLIDTIKTDFGIDIHHYVEINFASFKGIIDAVGGVPMYFDRPMRDEYTGLYQYELGCVTLDGEQGLAFARSRHLETQNDRGRWYTDPSGDLGRVNRQQVFLRAVLDRAQGRFGDVDVRAINDIISSTADNLSIDSGLDLGELVELARAFRGFSGEQIVTHTLPVTPFTTNGGASVLRLDDLHADETLNVFRGLPPGTVSPTSITLAVSNGSGAENEATRVSGELAALGYETSVAQDQARTATRTVVRYAPGYERHADQVARQLGAGAELQPDRTLASAKAPLVLVTGTDFDGVLGEARPPTSTTSTTAASTSSSTSSSSSSGGGGSTATTVDPDTITGPVGEVPNEPPEGTVCR